MKSAGTSSSAHSHCGEKISAAAKSGSATSTVSARMMNMPGEPPVARAGTSSARGYAGDTLGGAQLLARAPEAALTLLVRADRRLEGRGIEIRPQRFGEIELGVGELPQQKVADALLAARAD